MKHPTPLLPHAHPFIQLFTHKFIHILTHKFIHIFTHKFIHIFTHKFIHIFFHTFMHAFMHAFMHEFKHIYPHIHTPAMQRSSQPFSGSEGEMPCKGTPQHSPSHPKDGGERLNIERVLLRPRGSGWEVNTGEHVLYSKGRTVVPLTKVV